MCRLTSRPGTSSQALSSRSPPTSSTALPTTTPKTSSSSSSTTPRSTATAYPRRPPPDGPRDGTSQEQAEHERTTITVAAWRYIGTGYLHGENYWADAAYERIATARTIRRRATERDEQQDAS